MKGISRDLMRFIRILSCKDFRVDDLSLPRATRYWFLHKLKKLVMDNAVFVRHLSFLKPLGVRVAFGIKNDPVLARILLQTTLDNEIAGRLGFPLPFLLNSVSVLSGGRVFASWVIPPRIDYGPILDWGEVAVGWKVPVQTCVDEPTWDDIYRLGSRLEFLLSIGDVKLRTPLLAYVFIAILDKYRLLTLKEMASLTRVLDARDLGFDSSDGKLRWKYIDKYYRTLSEHNVLGRLVVFTSYHLGLPRFTVIADPQCAQEVYGAIGVGGYAGHIYYSDDFIVAHLLLDKRLQAMLGKFSSRCLIDVVARYRTIVFPFPYELYDPIEDKWSTKPVPEFVELLRRLGVLSG
jgi:hypothetical protein